MTDQPGAASIFHCTNPKCGRVWQSAGDNNLCSACLSPLAGSSDEAAAAQAVFSTVYGSAAATVHHQLLVVTTNDIPGYRITKVHGDVFGLTVRARNYFANFGAQLRTVVGGEVSGYTRLLTDSRNEARQRLMDEAAKTGANAVVAMRFDCNEIGEIMTEIAAYGTAVTIEQDPTTAGSPSDD
jgi:uncharacterized protein YbjQ (UPF0145 family)